MVEDALPWPAMGGTYLEVLGCLGTALGILLGGEMDFSTVDAFEMSLETGLTLVLVNSIHSNRSFPVMSTFNIVLAALEALRHMLGFRFSVSCFGFG